MATTSSRNIQEDQKSVIERRSGDPSDQQDRISYGEITKVIAKNSQVHIQLYNKDKPLLSDPEHPEGKPVPILQSLRIINHLYGSLSKGMKVRVFWIGKHDAKSAYAEVIGAEDFDLTGIINKEPEVNRQDTLPYLSVSGGVSI